jgi:hypothetical protein
MGFVNEKISEEDVKKYDFEGLSKTFHVSLSNLKYQWTIDRERSIFLVFLIQHREEEYCHFLLWWDGQFIPFSISYLATGNPYGELSITWDKPLFAFPDDFNASYDEVVRVLKEALIEYKFVAYNYQNVSCTTAFKF